MIEDILKKVNKIDLLVITWRYIFWSGNDSKRHFIRATVVLLSAAYKIISSDVTVESRMLIGQHPRRLTCLAISQSAISNLSWLILYIYIYIYTWIFYAFEVYMWTVWQSLSTSNLPTKSLFWTAYLCSNSNCFHLYLFVAFSSR
jgi:hypothetical protein